MLNNQSRRKKNSKFKPVVIYLKIELVSSCSLQRDWINTYITIFNLQPSWLWRPWNTPTASLPRSKTPPPLNKCPGYDTRPSDSEALVLKLWRMWSTSSLPLLPDRLWLKVIVPVSVLSIGQIELFNHLLETIE